MNSSSPSHRRQRTNNDSRQSKKALGNQAELPKDASEDFGLNLLEKIFPLLIEEDKEGVLAKATISKNGDLTPNFEYLRDYLNGL